MDYAIVENALPADLLQEVIAAIASGPYANGKDTATGLAKTLKNNLQLSPEVHRPLMEKIGLSIGSHPSVQAYAQPRQVSLPIINRYECGMEYGLHVDQAFMGEIRSDISFTLFLDNPASYDGGELILATQPQQVAFKLPAGSMVLYPTGALHRVATVTRGTRNAIVGWIQSRIRDTQKRNIVARLNAIKNTLGQQGDQTQLVLQSNECLQELIRMWGE